MALAFFYLREIQLQEEDDERFRQRKRRRISRDRFNITSIPDLEFMEQYRLNRVLFQKLCDELTPLLPPKQRQHGLDPSMKILSVLNFFAWGCDQGSIGQSFNMPVAQQTVSRCIKEVTDALNHRDIVRKYMRFPQNKYNRDGIKKKFNEKFGIPDAVGCIDCTHIAIIKPNQNENRCLNEKKYYSMKAQIVCDADCYILHVDPSYGGATRDCDIWLAHPVSEHLEGLQETAYLLADVDYPQQRHVMTPITEDLVENTPESRYNDIHKEAHDTIFKTLSMLKARWRCLLASKELHYTPETAAKMISACCVLHNMCNVAEMEAPLLTGNELEDERKRQYDFENFLQDCFDEGDAARARLVKFLENNRSKKQ